MILSGPQRLSTKSKAAHASTFGKLTCVILALMVWGGMAKNASAQTPVAPTNLTAYWSATADHPYPQDRNLAWTWTDNSSNEDGFQIDTFANGVFQFSTDAAANHSSVQATCKNF